MFLTSSKTDIIDLKKKRKPKLSKLRFKQEALELKFQSLVEEHKKKIYRKPKLKDIISELNFENYSNLYQVLKNIKKKKKLNITLKENRSIYESQHYLDMLRNRLDVRINQLPTLSIKNKKSRLIEKSRRKRKSQSLEFQIKKNLKKSHSNLLLEKSIYEKKENKTSRTREAKKTPLPGYRKITKIQENLSKIPLKVKYFNFDDEVPIITSLDNTSASLLKNKIDFVYSDIFNNKNQKKSATCRNEYQRLMENNGILKDSNNKNGLKMKIFEKNLEKFFRKDKNKNIDKYFKEGVVEENKETERGLKYFKSKTKEKIGRKKKMRERKKKKIKKGDDFRFSNNGWIGVEDGECMSQTFLEFVG